MHCCSWAVPQILQFIQICVHYRERNNCHSVLAWSGAKSAKTNKFGKNRTSAAVYIVLSQWDFMVLLTYVSLTSTIHLYLLVDEEVLVVKCEHWQSFSKNIDDLGKCRKQLEVCLFCWEHEACQHYATPWGSVCLFMASPCFSLPRKILCCRILERDPNGPTSHLNINEL